MTRFVPTVAAVVAVLSGCGGSLQAYETRGGSPTHLDGTKATDIAGSGSGQLTLADGAIYPSGTTEGETHFTVAASADKKIVLSIKTGATITTK